MSDSKIYVLLPAFNEEAALQALIPAIGDVLSAAGYPYRICIVDDGSTDGSANVIKSLADKFPLNVVRHPVNKGYGAALNTGYTTLISQAQASDIILSLDADTTHSPSYFPAMLQEIERGFDVVTASYSMKGGQAMGVPFKRRVMSWGANMLFWLFYPIKNCRTYTNGFRAYRVEILQRVRSRWGEPLIRETGFPGGTELFLKSIRGGAKASEVPFVLHYENRGSQSKLRLGRTIQSYLRLLGSLFLQRG